MLGDDVPLLLFSSATSTSDAAKDWARRGAPHGALVVAGEQTGGRGTRGRAFFSPPGGLYMSLVLEVGDIWPGHVTTLAAVAAANAAGKATGLPLHIKWVNDLVLEGRKAGGILTESVEREGRHFAIVGIGMNAGPWEPPDELRDTACTLHREGLPVDRERIVALTVRGIHEGLPRVPAHMNAYRALCDTIGQNVSFLHEGQMTRGIATAVDGDGALRVQTARGEVRLIAGDVSVRGTRGDSP